MEVLDCDDHEGLFSLYNYESDITTPVFCLPTNLGFIERQIHSVTRIKYNFEDISPGFESSDCYQKYVLIRSFLVRVFPLFRFEYVEDDFGDEELSFFMTRKIGDFQIDATIVIHIGEYTPRVKPIQLYLQTFFENGYYHDIHCHFIPNTSFHLPKN
jgi:hypothetical protein